MNFTLEEEKGEAEKSKNTSNMKIQLRPNSSTPPNKTSNSKRKKIIPQKNKITKYAFQQPRFPPNSSPTIFKKKSFKDQAQVGDPKLPETLASTSRVTEPISGGRGVGSIKGSTLWGLF